MAEHVSQRKSKSPIDHMVLRSIKNATKLYYGIGVSAGEVITFAPGKRPDMDGFEGTFVLYTTATTDPTDIEYVLMGYADSVTPQVSFTMPKAGRIMLADVPAGYGDVWDKLQGEINVYRLTSSAGDGGGNGSPPPVVITGKP